MRKLNMHHTPKRHFTVEQRSILQSLWNVNVTKGRQTRLSMRKFAAANGLAYSTVQRELNRGMEGGVFHDKIKREWFYPEYNASKAQGAAADKNAQKGTGMRVTSNHAAAFARHVLELKKSPAHARHDMIREGHKNVPCLSTFYYHIDHGDIGVLRGQTPYHPGEKRKRRAPVKRAKKCPGNLSIEERPPQAADRSEFGHWEMDTVVSCVGGRGGLLMLVERQTRFVCSMPLKTLTAKAVRKAIRRLLKDGKLKTARSITTDNGCEFLDSKALAGLFRRLNADLKIYYTHAYAAWEKGTVENLNRHVRRFFPKGTDFCRVTASDISAMQNFINSIPRTHSLKGKSAHEAFLSAA